MALASALLVDPDWLATHLEHPGLRIVDASWYLADAQRDARAEYRNQHLPGAVYLDLSSDLAVAPSDRPTQSRCIFLMCSGQSTWSRSSIRRSA